MLLLGNNQAYLLKVWTDGLIVAVLQELLKMGMEWIIMVFPFFRQVQCKLSNIII